MPILSRRSVPALAAFLGLLIMLVTAPLPAAAADDRAIAQEHTSFVEL